jgi:protein arginine kinase activator
MQCNSCNKKKATVHLTEIVDGQVSEMHLCEECARDKSAQMEQQFGLADLLAGLSDFGKPAKTVEKIKIKCEKCGLSYDEFRKMGRLGCAQCYESFRNSLSSLLKKIHGSDKHLGKMPENIAPEIKQEADDLVSLQDQLQHAISVENFEEAAKLRDKIKGLENKGE